MGSRHGQEAHGTPDDADGGGNQPHEFWKPSGRHLLDVPSRPRHPGHHADDRQGLRRGAPGSRRDRQALVPGGPSADQILDKYLEALGGVERLAKVTSFVATGTSEGFRGFGGGGTVQIFARAPDQRATIIKFDASIGRQDAIRTFDGKSGWVSAPLAVVPQYALGGSELDGARIDAQLSFPAQIKKVLTQLRVGPPDYIDGREVDVVQGNGSRGLVATLYFDKQTGLLVTDGALRDLTDRPRAHAGGLRRLP